MSVETWKAIFDWGTVVLIALTVVSGAGALITGNILNERQGKELNKIKLEAAQANERASALQLEALSIQKQLISQGSRAALLYGENRTALISRLTPFAGQKVEVRFCKTSFSIFHIDNEAMSVGMLLRVIMEKSDWSVNPPIAENCSSTGISVSVHPKASDATLNAANALLQALRAVPLTIVGDRVFQLNLPRPPQPSIFDSKGTAIQIPPLGTETVVVTVLGHP